MSATELEHQEMTHLLAIDDAIAHAAVVMDCGDVVADDDEEVLGLYEERHHCGVCQVRAVMETVWPAIDDYVNWLKSQIKA